MKIENNNSVTSPSPREIVLNADDVQALVENGELQAGPVTIKFEKTPGQGFSIGFSRTESRSDSRTDDKGTSENWSSGRSWSSTTGTSQSDK